MRVLAMYLVLVAAPMVVLVGTDRLLDWLSGRSHDAAPARSRALRRPWLSGRAWLSGRGWGSSVVRQGRRADPALVPLERLVADLQRLEQEYRRVVVSDLPARMSRCTALALAYDDTLRACCRAVGLPEPATPLSALDRLETEAALVQHGVSW